MKYSKGNFEPAAAEIRTLVLIRNSVYLLACKGPRYAAVLCGEFHFCEGLFNENFQFATCYK